MTINDLLSDSLRRNQEMLRLTLADFSDADMLVRPAEGANHANWQVGHLIVSESNILNAISPGAVTVPPEFAGKYSKTTAKLDDAGAFDSKAQLLDRFATTRAAMIEWAKSVKEDEWERPSPERVKSFAPTWALVAVMVPQHVVMHIGQFQVLRRRLGKPLLF